MEEGSTGARRYARTLEDRRSFDKLHYSARPYAERCRRRSLQHQGLSPCSTGGTGSKLCPVVRRLQVCSPPGERKSHLNKHHRLLTPV